MFCTGFLVSSRIQRKVLLFVARAQQGLAPKYLCDLTHKPLSAVSSRPLLSCTRTAMTQHLVFAIVGPSIWNGVQSRSPTIRSKIPVGMPPSLFCYLKIVFFSSLGN